MKWARLLFFVVFLLLFTGLSAQISPFSTGKWAKMGVKRQGIVKLTGLQLKTLGFNLPLVSSQLQIFSLNGSLLSESVPEIPPVGLQENAIQVQDGGDGMIQEGDFILFYHAGKTNWLVAPNTQTPKHQNRHASDTSFYFVTIGVNGKRIGTQNFSSNGSAVREKFTQHFLYEVDSVSLLNSGKVLWGIPMGQGAGKQAQISFPITTQQMSNSESIKTNVHLAATSYQSNGQFDFYWNNQLAHSSSLMPVSGLLFDDIANEKIDSFISPAAMNWPNSSVFKITFTAPGANATGWIDYVSMHVKKTIGFWQDSTIAFHLEDDFVTGNVYTCKVQNTDASTLIWNVSDPQNPSNISLQIDPNGIASFNQKVESATQYFGAKYGVFETPILLGPVANQNTLTIQPTTNYLIITAPAYLNAAKQYQAFQLAKMNRTATVVNAVELYNDFSGGQPTAIAIRNYLKYVLNKASINQVAPPEYLLFIGMGNFNNRNLNYNFELPVFESNNSTSILSSYTTDDFFSSLNTQADINLTNQPYSNQLAVGRIPARSEQDADSTIAKLIRYQTTTVAGAWANKLTWIADDGDYNLHLQDAEAIIANLASKENKWNHKKLYLDLFPATNTSSGKIYPLANAALRQAVEEGSLMINYTGHGNYLRLAEEAIVSQEVLNGWNNATKLPLLVAASCNFAPYDQPNLNAIAWDAFMKNSKGIIGMVAANRLVFAYSNKQINDLFIQQLFVPDAQGKYPSIGKALQKAKLANMSLGGDRVNAYKFNLIGDPALQLAAPQHKISVQGLNNRPFFGKDTILTGVKNTLQGKIQNEVGEKVSFNGVVELSIYNATKWVKTIANQSTSMSVPIATQESILFKGKATVSKGEFTIDFILPTQVSNVALPIRFTLAAQNDSMGALQVIDSIYVKPNTLQNLSDTVGPQIDANLNDMRFTSGAWASPNTTLFVRLKDTSGIQTSGNALGHDLSIWLDANPIPIIVNNYFIADVNSYQSGKVQYSFSNLSEGSHTLIIKAWDLLGNGAADTIQFEVPPSNQLILKNPYVYPNPFREKAKFGMEVNVTGKEIQSVFEVRDQNGQLMYSKTSNFFNASNRVELEWNGVTSAGTPLQTGVYYYQWKVQVGGSVASLASSFIKL
jgi:hypothetical protein